jgi:drug/metabolite transporter (DMT)-like permease
VALAVLCCALWGGNTVAVKFTVPDVPPLACAGVRFALGLPLIALADRLAGASLRPDRDDFGLLFANGVLLFVQIATFNVGTAWTLAGRASLLINVHPFIVTPLAWLLLGERLTRAGLAGLLLAAGGIAWLFWEPLQAAGGSLGGDLTLLASAVILGGQTVYQKFVLRSVRATTLLFWQTVVALPLFFAASAAWEDWSRVTLTAESAAGLAYQGWLVSGLCFLIWFKLVHEYPVSQLATLGFLTPVFGVAAGVLLLGEVLSGALVGGTVLVGLGIYLVARGRTVPTTPAMESDALSER